MKQPVEKFRVRDLHIAAEILGMRLDQGLKAIAERICHELKAPKSANKKRNRSLVKQFNERHKELAVDAAKAINARKKKRNAHRTTLPVVKITGPLQPIGEPHKDYKKDPSFYDTRQWKELRYMALKNNGARCQCCGASAADGEVIHVDHIEPIYKRPDLKLEMDNLQILCSSCNQGKGAWDNTDWREHMKSI